MDYPTKGWDRIRLLVGVTIQTRPAKDGEEKRMVKREMGEARVDNRESAVW